MLKKVLRWAGGIVGVIALAAAVFLINLIWFRPWSLNLFFEKTFLQAVLDQPEYLTSLGLLEQYGFRGHGAHLDDPSIERQQRAQARTRQALEDLKHYDLTRRDSQEKLSVKVATWIFENDVRGEAFAFHDYPVNQLFGVQSETPSFMVNIHRVADRKDADQYLSRLSEWGRKFDQLIAALKYRQERGIVPPRFVVTRVLTEMRDFIAAPARENILAKTFAEKLAKVEALSASERTELAARAESLVTTVVYPAYQRLITFMSAQEAIATTDDGVWKLPDGDAYYAYALRTNTTSSLTPDEIHQLGLREVKRIEDEMRTILGEQGMTGKTPGEWLNTLTQDRRFLYQNNDDGRATAIARYNTLLSESLERSRQNFGTLPVAKLEVQRIPEFREATAPPAYYWPPAMDGSRPGVFYANLRNMDETPMFSMKTYAYHEGIPGHHFQIAIANELKGLPTFRKAGLFTAYVEGWALYAEALAFEMGLYQDDPYGNLGRLRAELWRAVRLVVDTGIHAKHWTREQAIAYMKDKTGMRESEVVSEIERYIVLPGQACAYKVGMIKIQELRRKAESSLGASFDLKAFHDVILRNGALPLEVLEGVVNEWIQQQPTTAVRKA